MSLVFSFIDYYQLRKEVFFFKNMSQYKKALQHK